MSDDVVPHNGVRQVEVPSRAALHAALEAVRRYLPVTRTAELSGLGEGLHAKIEFELPTGSFKVRGALAAVAAAQGGGETGQVVTASAGNHGLGLAYAAGLLGAPATVVVPRTASAAKVAKLRATGVTLVQEGATYPEAEAFALAHAEQIGARFISAYNDPHVIAGQATIAAELLQQLPGLARVVVPVGGGGLASGIALGLAGSGVEVIGVQPRVNAAMAAALVAGEILDVEVGETVADGLAGGVEAGSVTFTILAEHLDQMVTVTEEEIAQAVAWGFTSAGLLLEGSAAVGIAAIRSGAIAPAGLTAVVLTGRNITPSLYARLLLEGTAGIEAS